MNTTDSASNVRAPKLQPQQVTELQDFWKVYESHRPEIMGQLLQIANEHPEFTFLLRNQMQTSGVPDANRELQSRAIYPRGLKGELIPLAARLFAVVDVWDALRSDRPYRKAWSIKKTREHIRSLSGTHFDPSAVQHFLEMMEGSID